MTLRFANATVKRSTWLALAKRRTPWWRTGQSCANVVSQVALPVETVAKKILTP